MADTRNIEDGSEYGGVEGLIQPSPHEPTAAEKLQLIYVLNPAQADKIVPDIG